MSHIPNHRLSGRAALIVAAILFAVVSGASIPLTLRLTAEAETTVETSKQVTTMATQGQINDQLLIDDNCKVERKITPTAGDTLYPYFERYLLCAEPTIMSDEEHFTRRKDQLLEAYRVAFPDQNPEDLQPGVTIQILGSTGCESIDPRFAGVTSST